ncbi:MAG: rRNA adenine N(6)-methyltransferase family protein [Chloroflexota bacterium]|nr:rRNA adenine N(6)-methyltransferase family protein [Chloroflexota bacterium]
MHEPRHRSIQLSQNFLRSHYLVDYLLNAADIGADDLVWEVGPGNGIITERLARRCQKVVAVEKDPALARRVDRVLSPFGNVTLVVEDFRDVELPCVAYKVFSNLPFNITTDVVTKLIAAPCPPLASYLIMQREAAERFTGQPVESVYSVLLKPWFEPSVLYHFQRSDFAPAPSVAVVMLRLRKRGPPLVAEADAQLYRDFTTHVFATSSVGMARSLGPLLGSKRVLRDFGLDDHAKPSEVRFEQWLSLFYGFKLAAGKHARQQIAGAEERMRQQQQGLHKHHRTRPRREHH